MTPLRYSESIGPPKGRMFERSGVPRPCKAGTAMKYSTPLYARCDTLREYTMLRDDPRPPHAHARSRGRVGSGLEKNKTPATNKPLRSRTLRYPRAAVGSP